MAKGRWKINIKKGYHTKFSMSYSVVKPKRRRQKPKRVPQQSFKERNANQAYLYTQQATRRPIQAKNT